MIKIFIVISKKQLEDMKKKDIKNIYIYNKYKYYMTYIY